MAQNYLSWIDSAGDILSFLSSICAVFIAFIFSSRRQTEFLTNPIFRYSVICCVIGLTAASRLFAKGSVSDVVSAASLAFFILALAREIWLADSSKPQ